MKTSPEIDYELELNLKKIEIANLKAVVESYKNATEKQEEILRQKATEIRRLKEDPDKSIRWLIALIMSTIFKKCPECAGALEIKRNRKTKAWFWGCSNYPNCKYTESGDKKKDKDLNAYTLKYTS